MISFVKTGDMLQCRNSGERVFTDVGCVCVILNATPGVCVICLVYDSRYDTTEFCTWYWHVGTSPIESWTRFGWVLL